MPMSRSRSFNLKMPDYPKIIEPHFADDADNTRQVDYYVITLTADEYNAIMQDDQAFAALAEAVMPREGANIYSSN